jgi:hypothetical protein
MREKNVLAYSIAWERHGAYIAYRDTVRFAEFMDAVLTIHANDNYATTKYVIHDMLAAALDFSDLDMTAMVAQELGARFTNPGVRPAVVSSDPTMEEKTRTFSALTGLDVGFFPSLQQARAWAAGPTEPPP